MIPFLLLAIAAVPIYSWTVNYRRNGDWYFLNPINGFWVAFLYAGVVQPLLSASKWIAYYDEATLTSTLGMFLVLGVAVHLGYNSVWGDKISRRVPDLSRPSQRKVFWCGVFLIVVGLIGYFLVIRASGGWAHWSSSPRSYTKFQALSGYVYTLPRVATLGIMVLLCHAFSWREAPLLYKFGVVALALLNLVWQMYSGTREGAIVMLIILVGSIYGAQNRNPPWLAMGALVAAAFFFFGFIPTYRAQFRDLQFKTDETPRQVLQNSLDFYSHPDGPAEDEETPDLWSDFGMAISVAYYVPAQLDFDYGQMLLETFTRPIPRGLWPGKSYPEGEAWDRFHRVSGVSDVTNAVGLRAGPSPTMVGKYYYIGGWVGLMVGGFFSGTLLSAIGRFLRRNSHLVTGAVFGVATAGLGAMEMIHPLSWSVNLWLPTIAAPFVLMVWLVRDKSAPALATEENGAPVAAGASAVTEATIAAQSRVHPGFERRAARAPIAYSSLIAPAPADLRVPRFSERGAERGADRDGAAPVAALSARQDSPSNLH